MISENGWWWNQRALASEDCFCKTEERGAALFSAFIDTDLSRHLYLMDYRASSKEMLEESMKFPPNNTVIGRWKSSYKTSFSLPSTTTKVTSDTAYCLYKVYYSDCFIGIADLIPNPQPQF